MIYDELEIILIPTAKTSRIIDVNKPVIINYKKSGMDDKASIDWIEAHLAGDDTNRYTRKCLDQHNRCRYMDVCPVINAGITIK